MLNINPINHNTNINFKSQRDYSQIYKKMEKIASINYYNRPKHSLLEKMEEEYPFLFTTLSVIVTIFIPAGAFVGLTLLCQTCMNEIKSGANKNASSIEQVKTDSLINLYQNKKITFEDFQKKYDELIRKGLDVKN